MTHQYRIAGVPKLKVPQAKFSYNLAPVEVRVNKAGMPFYEYLTSMLAIVGGSFTVIGLMQGTMHTVSKKIRKENQGKLG